MKLPALPRCAYCDNPAQYLVQARSDRAGVCWTHVTYAVRLVAPATARVTFLPAGAE